MVKDDNEVMSNISILNLPDVIELRSELPQLYNVRDLLGTINRWKEIRDYFKHPVRIYGSCANPAVEKYLQKVVANYNDIFLTIVPVEREEMLDYEELRV